MRLVAVLLNPVQHGGPTITERNVRAASGVLEAAALRLVNLVPSPTRDLPELSAAASDRAVWLSGRSHLREAVCDSDLLLFAWGLDGLTGPARQHHREQVDWLIRMSAVHGHQTAFVLDGRPRHPSRWRQYLGPTRGLFLQATFDERLRAALSPVPLSTLAALPPDLTGSSTPTSGAPQ